MSTTLVGAGRLLQITHQARLSNLQPRVVPGVVLRARERAEAQRHRRPLNRKMKGH
jgi:hypothetical protein